MTTATATTTPTAERIAEVQALAAANLGLVGFALRQPWLAPHTRTLGTVEAFSVGTLALVQAAWSYDPARGTEFSTLAIACIRNAICRAVEVELRQRRPEQLSAIDAGGVEAPAVDPLAGLVVEEALATLPARQAEAVRRHYLDGESQPDIGESWGTSSANVQHSLQRGRVKLMRKWRRDGAA